MTFKTSDKAQTITVFNLRSDTNEFIGASDAYIPARTGLPAHCTDISPPEIPENMAAVFDGNVWSVLQDHRGKTVYDTDTGESIFIEKLGALPVNTVSIATTGEFVKWDGKKWVHDSDAEKANAVRTANEQKITYINEATKVINTLQDAIELEMATNQEREKLIEWKKYRVLLMRVNTEHPDFPVQPHD